MSTNKKGLFTLPDGRNLALTFFLVASLFFIWGFCNGLIDTMDKLFQDKLNLTKAQSAWVQFAHYIGYSIMALPAGFITLRLGYKGGIIFGLALVSLGGFWFLPATHIATFPAFLLGVCMIAMGLTVLETVANPYTTVLGPKEYGPTRINLAQSFNGVGWLLAPVAASVFFYSTGGVEQASRQLYIPYLGIALLVLVVAALFFRAPVPDIKVEDEYHTDDRGPAAPVAKEHSPALVLIMMFFNVAAVGLSLFLVLYKILPAIGKAEEATLFKVYGPVIGVVVLLTLPFLFAVTKRVTTHSIWAHPHFSGATLAQFFYVAAQAGIFSFFINSMTVDKMNGSAMVPPLAASWGGGALQEKGYIEVRTAFAPSEIKDYPALAAWLKTPADPVATFVSRQLSANKPNTAGLLAEYQPGGQVDARLQGALVADLNRIIRQELNNKAADQPGAENNKPALYDQQRFAGVNLSAETQQLLAKAEKTENEKLRLNRLLLHDAVPATLTFHNSVLSISDKGASLLSTLAFACFLLGRLTGAWALKKAPAHRTLGLYSALNICVCALIMANMGWISVIAVFISYFFMSIMFPTIFALGIFGLGSQSKKKASAFIVMSITGGALMPTFMGYLGDVYNMSVSFLMPLVCFILIALYGFSWSKLSNSEGITEVKASGGH